MSAAMWWLAIYAFGWLTFTFALMTEKPANLAKDFIVSAITATLWPALLAAGVVRSFLNHVRRLP